MTVRRVRVGDVLRLERERIQPDLTSEYRQIGVYSWGKGIIENDSVSGADLSKVSYFRFPVGALILSNIQAWEAAIAVSEERHRDFIASQRFLPYVPRRSGEVDVRYLCHFFLSDPGMQLIRKASPGTVTRNRTLGIAAFESLTIPLPSLDEQRAIANRLDQYVGAAKRLSEKQAERIDFLASTPGLVHGVFRRADLPMVSASSLYDVIPDVIHVDDDPRDAGRFVGLEHVQSHTGQRMGSSGIEDRRGRKLLFRKDDVLFGYLRPYLNKVWVADGPGLCSVEQYVLRPRHGVDADLLGYALRSERTLDAVKEATHHLQLPRIRTGLLGAIDVPDVRRAPMWLKSKLDAVTGLASSIAERTSAQEGMIRSLPQAARNEVFAALL